MRGRKVKLFRGGAGAPLLFLHDEFCPSWLSIHDLLAARFEVFVPIHPGFAGSEESFDEFEEMEDLVFHYVDLCATLGVDRPILVGASFGGWIAAEWAMRYSGTLSRLVLIDALGLRVDDAPASDILSLDGPALRQALFGDPTSALAMETIPDTPKAEEMVSTILARRTLARFAWQFPDNPRLQRLSLSHPVADADRLGRARRLCICGAWQALITRALPGRNLKRLPMPAICRISKRRMLARIS